MKQFLYLVQARARLATKHLALESERSDVLILTFDEQLDGKHFLYGPKTIWPQGRNMLIAKARSLPHQYDYYIMLDDDLEFLKGSYREFEDEVLKLQPDHCVPSWGFYNPISIYSHCDYCVPLSPDCCFDCLSRELFFDPRLLPYRTDWTSINLAPQNPQSGIFASDLFWHQLCEHFWDRKILVINKLCIANTKSEVDYGYLTMHKTRNSFYRLILAREHIQRIKNRLPLYYYRQIIMLKRLNVIQHWNKLTTEVLNIEVESQHVYAPRNLVKLLKFFVTPGRTKVSRKHLAKVLGYHLCFSKLRVLDLYLIYIAPKIFWRNLRLNRRIRKGLDWKISDF